MGRWTYCPRAAPDREFYRPHREEGCRACQRLFRTAAGIEAPNVGVTCSRSADIAGAARSGDTSLRLFQNGLNFAGQEVVVL